jgi:hypothetical protein
MYKDGGYNVHEIKSLDFTNPATYNSSPVTIPSVNGQFQSTPDTTVPYAGNANASPTPGSGTPANPLPDSASRALTMMSNFIQGNSTATVKTQQAQAAQAQQQQVQADQAQAQAAQQQGAQAGVQQVQQAPPPSQFNMGSGY